MTVRFGIIGAGGIARSYLQVFSGLQGAEFNAVADVDPGAAASFAEGTDASVHSDVEDLLAHADVDAVVVCTPPDVHPEVALAAIRAGTAVLCEKPLAIGVEAARRMVSAATIAGVQFTMATKFRFVDAVVQARRLVDSGALGELIHIENVFASRVDMAQRWNSVRAVSGGGVLIDNGTHSVDIARHFLGPIREALVVEAPRTQSLDVEDSVQLLLRSDTDATATIDLSWSYDNVDDHYLRVYGSEGALRIGWERSEFRTNEDAEWRAFASRYDKLRCVGAQVRNFCAALEGREALAVTAADAIASVQVIDAAYRSMTRGLDGDRTGAHGPSRGWRCRVTPPGDISIHPTAEIEQGVTIGPGTAIWSGVHVRGPGTSIGASVIVGERTYIAYGVIIGDRSKINAGAYLCTGVTLGQGVMVGAGSIFTNDRYPRATTPDLRSLRPSGPDEHTRPTVVEDGATIGAGSVVGADLTVGRFAMVGMGAVVTRTVAPFHLVVGQPARPVAVVSRVGEPLLRFSGARPPDRELLTCRVSGLRYATRDGVVEELDPPS